MFEVSRFGGGGETSLGTIALVFILVSLGLLFSLPRRYSMPVLLFPMMLIPLSQGFVIGPIHLQSLRLMILAGWIRALMDTGTVHPRKGVNLIDLSVVIWVLIQSISFCLLWGETQAILNRLGVIYNVLGIYFLLRMFLHTTDDILLLINSLAVITTVIGIAMLTEQFTGHNVFATFGGLPDLSPTRGGRVRSQGPFSHALLAGAFGATVTPLFIGALFDRRYRLWGSLGIISATIVTITSATSTSLIAYAVGIASIAMWPMRRYTQVFRWALVLLLFSLHLAMKAPVWALIGRIGVVGGSSSYHRYQLIDQFIRRFNEWWLVGIRSTANWGWFLGDTANQYVDIGVTGGILSLLLFIAIIIFSFRQVGITLRQSGTPSTLQVSFWALGSSLIAHVAAFIGVIYFDQTIVPWWALVAMIATTSYVPIPKSTIAATLPQLTWYGSSDSMTAK